MIELRPDRKVYKTSRRRRMKAMLRRDRLRDMKVCINGEAHGPATDGVLCRDCRETHG